MSDSSSGQSSYSSDDGPNRRITNPSTWHKYTDKERGVYASLVRARNEDLSLHLYNAHVLRQRAEEYKKDPVNAKVNFEYPDVPENHRTFRPPNRWTAWPLTPEDVPRANDKFIKKDGLDSYTLKKKQIEWPSRELEEELLGAGLRLARKRFDERESEENEANSLETSTAVSPSGNEIEFDDDEGSKSGSINSCEVLEWSIHPQQVSDGSQQPYLKSVFCCDDEKSRQIFHPSIRHIILDVEKVLKGLHRSRKAYFSCIDSEPNQNKKKFHKSQLEIRSREKDRVIDSSEQNLQDSFQVTSQIQESLSLTPQHKESDIKKSRRGRPRKIYERLDGETEQEFLVRIARKKKKTIPVFPPLSKRIKSIRPVRKYRRSATERFNIRQKGLGLRDWSEVLGLAALVGISADAVARATQRCANLFDESIIIRSMVEASHENQKADSTILYKPAKSSDASTSINLPTLCASYVDSRNIDVKESKIFSSRTNALTSQSQLCPIPRCPRMLQKFKNQNALFGRLKKCHDIEKHLAENFILPSHEDMDGAVHIDGFLRSIQLKTCEKNRFQTSPGKRKDADIQIETSDEDSGEIESSSSSGGLASAVSE